MSEEKKQAPLKTLRDGSVVIKLWQQDSKKGPFVTATIGNTYKDPKTGEFKESRSFSENDLLKLQVMVPEARKEAILWKNHFKEMERPQNLSQQRDEVMERAAPSQRSVQREQGRER
jgi:hypothetical protein